MSPEDNNNQNADENNQINGHGHGRRHRRKHDRDDNDDKDDNDDNDEGNHKSKKRHHNNHKRSKSHGFHLGAVIAKILIIAGLCGCYMGCAYKLYKSTREYEVLVSQAPGPQNYV